MAQRHAAAELFEGNLKNGGSKVGSVSNASEKAKPNKSSKTFSLANSQPRQARQARDWEEDGDEFDEQSKCKKRRDDAPSSSDEAPLSRGVVAPPPGAPCPPTTATAPCPPSGYLGAAFFYGGAGNSGAGGIHNIRQNARGHVYLEGEASVSSCKVSTNKSSMPSQKLSLADRRSYPRDPGEEVVVPLPKRKRKGAKKNKDPNRPKRNTR